MADSGIGKWDDIERLVGVYEANGGFMGEFAYVMGRAVGQAHCALCDITHSTFRRKPEWDQFVRSIPVPFELVHLNERDAVVLPATQGRTPCVVAVMRDGGTRILLTADALEAADGSIDHFADRLRSAVLDAPPPRRSDPVAPPNLPG
jgi:hypothetical protein